MARKKIMQMNQHLDFIPKRNFENRIFESITEYEVYCCFVKKRYEVLYIVEGDLWRGVISPGDYYRYLKNECNTYINYKASFSDGINFEKANEIFLKLPFINEIPVVNENKLVGIISNGKVKSEEEWERIQDSYRIKCARYYSKLSETILHWYNQNGISFYLLTYPSYEDIHFDVKELGTKRNYANGMTGFLNMSESEKQSFFGPTYFKGMAEEFAEDFNKIRSCEKEGKKILEDMSSKYINIIDGHRYIKNKPVNARHKLYIMGPCAAFGAYVNDDQTIGYYLQELVNCNGFDYEVIISANIGSFDLSPLFCESMGNGDIVIFFALHPEAIMSFNNSLQVNIINIQEAFIHEENIEGKLFNGLLHHNYIINRNIADCIFQHIKLFKDLPEPQRRTYQNYFIPYEIIESIKDLKYETKVKTDCQKNIGAIVMNCNPFTYGHKFLIEKAMRQVETLFIFVVEEDKSVFKFVDRLEMVKKGVEDLEGEIYVLPSGKYIISNTTFSQYFDKEKKIEMVNNMDYDVRIFGEVVAKEFGINKRFAGDEPNDIVTSQYNETMKRILPQYGIEFVEVPRKKIDKDEIISATKVRQLIQEEKWEDVKKYVPISTINIIRKKKEV